MPDEVPYWLERAEHGECPETVLVDRFGNSFHDPGKMDTEWDLEESSVEEAAIGGARPCHKCFSRLHSRWKTDQVRTVKELQV